MAKQRRKESAGGTTRGPDIKIPRISVNRIQLFDPKIFLAQAGLGRTVVNLEKRQIIFSQSDPAEAIFYIHHGKVKLSVISKGGKEATIALLGEGDFLGEECIANSQSLRLRPQWRLPKERYSRLIKRR